MNVVCKLKGDYRDIRMLRKIRGISIKELSELIFRTESYVTQLETGKINLTIDNYNMILDILGFERDIKTSFSMEDIKKDLKGKGGMYMRNSRKEIAKQIVLNYIEKMKDEWCVEGVAACLEVVKLLDKKNPVVKIPNNDYAVYDGSDCGSYDYPVGTEFRIDTEILIDEIIENCEYLLEWTWSAPCVEKARLDFYLLL